MKALLLRVSALAGLVILGCIAFAHAQRDVNDTSVSINESTAESNPLRNPNAASPLRKPLDAGRTTDPRPIEPRQMESGQADTRQTASASETRSQPADPFGLQSHRDANASSLAPAQTIPNTTIPDAAAGDLPPPRNNALRSASQGNALRENMVQNNAPRNLTPKRTPESQQLAAVDQPAGGNGPTLINNRYATNPRATNQRQPARIINQYATETPQKNPSKANQEPSRFMADPFAQPANAKQSNTSEPRRLEPVERDRGEHRFVSPVDTSHAPNVEAVVEADGVGQPGARQLEGLQSPQLTIQKSAPKEIQVGKQVNFRTTVRNVGQVAAGDVEIRDVVPKGTRLVNTVPQASRGENGELVWKLGTLRPGEERPVEMQIMPTAEGEIGSVATVHFGVSATARSIATRPQLLVETAGPQKVLIGDQAMLRITVSNPGTGIATGVVLEERIPQGMQHPAGAELEYEIGDLKPGESKKLDLPLVANRAGMVTNILGARANGNLKAEHKLEFEVLAPQLDVAMEGPKRRYLERQATYQVSVTNPGTAPAKQVELIASLPPGLKFVSANNAGYYEETTRTVRWRLEELPANETGSVELVTMPIQPGQHSLKVRTVAEKGLTAEKEQPVIIEGVAAILFQVADTADPIQVGEETTYEVHVVNRGSKAASDVRLEVIMPPELKPLAAEGPARHSVDGSRVYFDGLATLAPKAETTYRIRAKSLKAGDLRTRFQLQTSDMQSPVTKEENTRVYADE